MLFNLKANHKPVQEYYKALRDIKQLSLFHEGAVAPAFANLLRVCAGRMGWTLVEQYAIPRKGRKPLRADGVLLDQFNLRHGIWEAKDSQDDLAAEVKKKFGEGYPQDNILFQAPDRAILYQNGHLIADEDITNPDTLVDILRLFCDYQPPEYEQWETAVNEFKERVPELAQSLLTLIETERQQNRRFRDALASFKELMREALNPNLSDQAVEEMLIQHLLTERIFRKVFNNPDFAQRNIVAREIEKVIEALTSRHFSRTDFLQGLDRFYGAIETTAASITEYSEKQAFLNTVYENFFQGFSVKVADTHGIVYTPQPIVDFMVRSVDDILRREFGKADGLASDGVAILDPFVGTGNFVLRLLRQMPKSKLPHKYAHELFCNEVMLLPYYIASMNIEHEYYELTGRYEPFKGISLVDTFELAEGRQLPLFAPENSQRVQRQKNTPIFVVIGNPPYNAWQVNENDNSKNRKYPVIDGRVAETYVKDSDATLNNALYDPYVKAFRWATDRISDEGIVAYVSNNSFIDQIAFDGMRKHLAQEFDAVYVLDLGGNVRKNPKLSGTTHNVFGIQVGVSIAFLVRHKNQADERQSTIYYARTDEFWRKEEKYDFLDAAEHWQSIDWKTLQPNRKHIWLTGDMEESFYDFMQLGSKADKRSRQVESVFYDFSNGVKTNNDAYVYNFNHDVIEQSAQSMVEDYNIQRDRHIRQGQPKDVDEFLVVNEARLKWIRNTKRHLIRGTEASFKSVDICHSIYRPYASRYYFFNTIFNEDLYRIPQFFPSLTSQSENQVICVSGIGSSKPFHALVVNLVPCLDMLEKTQCFPFYTYGENGHHRRENITDWALSQFRAVYAQVQRTSKAQSPNPQSPISKWDIFHYIYALLHHPTYRDTYAANLRRELPRIPFVQPQHFWHFVQAGERLAHIHVHYEAQPQYPLQQIENPDEPLNFRVEKMRLSKDKTSLKVNDFLTLANIPPQVFDYKLGNRSALDWVIDQYQIKTDPRSGITNDPNNLDDETYILRLIKQVITVSLETVAIVNSLPPLDIMDDHSEAV